MALYWFSDAIKIELSGFIWNFKVGPWEPLKLGLALRITYLIEDHFKDFLSLYPTPLFSLIHQCLPLPFPTGPGLSKFTASDHTWVLSLEPALFSSCFPFSSSHNLIPFPSMCIFVFTVVTLLSLGKHASLHPERKRPHQARSSHVPVMGWNSDNSDSDARKVKRERRLVGEATLASAERKDVMFARWKKDQFRKERKIIFKLWRVPQSGEK